MNFLDAETDDADFRGAARVAMVMAMVSVVALESHRDQGMMAENKKNSRGRKKWCNQLMNNDHLSWHLVTLKIWIFMAH